MGVSIVVCCYNSANRLPKTLKHIADQKLRDDIEWELIIINNNSTDSTKKIAQEFGVAHPFLNMTVIDEPKPGLSNARYTGFENARFEYIILCDDDNWLEENYLQNVYDLLESKSEIGIVGGIGHAVTEKPIPDWLKKNGNSYAVGQLSGGGYVKYVYGAGMGLRKSLLQQALNMGFVSLLSDRKGKELSSGGDLELCYIFQLMGYKVYQSQDLNFQHYIESSKLSGDYWKRLNIGFAKTLLVLRPYDLVLRRRKGAPGTLWLKEYLFIVKEAFTNVFRKSEDWNYLKSSLRIMLSQRKSFCSNLKTIRLFFSKIKQ